jgi:hypothetical protein
MATKRKQSLKPNRARRGHTKTQITIAQAQAPRFQRLAHDIASAPIGMSHEEFEALLEFYVDDENHGKNSRSLYPKAWKHRTDDDRSIGNSPSFYSVQI